VLSEEPGAKISLLSIFGGAGGLPVVEEEEDMFGRWCQ